MHGKSVDLALNFVMITGGPTHHRWSLGLVAGEPRGFATRRNLDGERPRRGRYTLRQRVFLAVLDSPSSVLRSSYQIGPRQYCGAQTARTRRTL
eukprot:3335940-Rhodomonas_salina.1